MSKFLDELEREYGAVTKERLADFCISSAYLYRERKRYTLRHVFGKGSMKHFRTAKQGIRYYEDLWLREAQLTRQYFYDLLSDKKEHPHAKYFYIPSEEGTKKRMLNLQVGYMICQLSTLGWSPASEACNQCTFIQDCQQETQRKFPELYRIRLEHGK